jgi:hypothetical protein
VYQVKISSFPNSEVRLTFSTCGGGRKKNSSSLASLPTDLCGEPGDSDVSGSLETSALSDLTLALNSMAAPAIAGKRSKSGRFTLEAKRKILRAGGALDEFGVKSSHCLLLTGTLPGSTKEAMNEIPKHSGYIVNRLKMWIRERYKESSFSFYCWELQKRGALHIHYCVYCPCLVASGRIIAGFRAFWIRLLEDISDKSGVDLFAKSYGGSHRNDTKNVQVDAQRCRKSVAAYMAKYVTKEAGRGHRSRYPSRWSGVSRPLTALIRSFTKETVAVTPGYRQGRTLYEDARQYLTGIPKGCHTYPHKVGIGETRVAYYSQDKELQECQYRHASERLSSTPYCQQSSVQSQGAVSLSLLINTMQSIVRQAYDYLGNGLISSEVGLGATLQQLLRELSIASQAHKSVRSLRREVTGLITSQLTSPCVKFIDSVPERFRESIRLTVRSLWHLRENTLSASELLSQLRIVSSQLTQSSEEMYRSTTDRETLSDVGREAYQLSLCV